MPTFAADQELERRVADAWSAYRDALRDLEGREYEDAEGAAWDALQRELSALSG